MRRICTVLELFSMTFSERIHLFCLSNNFQHCDVEQLCNAASSCSKLSRLTEWLCNYKAQNDYSWQLKLKLYTG